MVERSLIKTGGLAKVAGACLGPHERHGKAVGCFQEETAGALSARSQQEAQVGCEDGFGSVDVTSLPLVFDMYDQWER